jgi:putative ABC transport system ATP-binding protein
MNAMPAHLEPPVAEATAPLLRVEGLSKSFHQGPVETHVLRSASMELARGETVSLVGASGSGKSTLLALLAGLMLPESGSVTFDGQKLADLDDVERAVLRASRIGIVLQSGNLIPFLTAFENVKLAIELAGGVRAAAPRAKELLSEFGLAHRLHHLPRRLSGGEAQRASLAVALANEPDVLLADEVTGELDSASAHEVMRLILRARRQRGLAVLFVTHSKEIAERAQRRLRLVDGEVVQYV